MLESGQGVIPAASCNQSGLEVYIDPGKGVPIIHPVIGRAAADNDIVGVAGIHVGIVAAGSSEIFDATEVCQCAGNRPVKINRASLHVDVDTNGAGVGPDQRIGSIPAGDGVELIVVACHADDVIAIISAYRGCSGEVVSQVVVPCAAMQFVSTGSSTQGVVAGTAAQDVAVAVAAQDVVERRAREVLNVVVGVPGSISQIGGRAGQRGCYPDAAAGVRAMLVTCRICSRTTIQNIAATHAFESVVAGSATEYVDSGIPDQRVCEIRTFEIFDAVIGVTGRVSTGNNPQTG